MSLCAIKTETNERMERRAITDYTGCGDSGSGGRKGCGKQGCLDGAESWPLWRMHLNTLSEALVWAEALCLKFYLSPLTLVP